MATSPHRNTRYATDAGSSHGRFRVGLDIGGTFTDLAVHDGESGGIFQFKSLTTSDPLDCVTRCLDKAATHFHSGLDAFLPQVRLLFCFGSTIGLNTLLTHTGAQVGILTTKGHGDVYRIAQMARGGVIDVREAHEQTFKPLVPRRRVAEVTERLDYTGRVVVPLSEADVVDATRRLVDHEEVDALVISFLWAHRNDSHERRAQEIVAELYPQLFISVGSELSGNLGEFRRTSTAVINAYIGRAVKEQGERIEAMLTARGLTVPLLVMQTLGGVAPLAEVIRRPVLLLNSGPAGGVVGALAVAKELDVRNVVCMDVGGTSCDISAISEQEIELSGGMKVSGHPIAASGIDIESVGAGGGSIATLERGGGVARLRVGPESAGADPGPACYGLGGRRPTATDANMVLGLLNASLKLGGELALDAESARAAITSYASTSRSTSDVVDDAWGIYRVITAHMSDAIESYLVSRGLDPRRFSLAAFGAAAGVHAAAIGARLGSACVVIPNFFPVFSALGLMTTDMRHAYTLTDDTVRLTHRQESAKDLDTKAEYVTHQLRRIAAAPLKLLDDEGVAPVAQQVNLFVDMRYAGQVLELSSPIPAAVLETGLEGTQLEALLEQWTEKYKRVYGEGAAWEEAPIELINYRAIGVGEIETPRFGTVAATDDGDTNRRMTRRIYLGDWLEAAVWREADLRAGTRIEGPALVEDDLRTVLVGPGDELAVHPQGHLLITPGHHWEW